MEEEAKSRIQQYKDYAIHLRDRYRVFEQEAATHYEKIAEDMRDRVKKQIKEQTDIHNKLKWDIEQNNILITFLQQQLDDTQKKVQDREKEIQDNHIFHTNEIDWLKRKTEEDRAQEIQDAKDRQREMSIDCYLLVEPEVTPAEVQTDKLEVNDREQQVDEFPYDINDEEIQAQPSRNDISIDDQISLRPATPPPVEEVKRPVTPPVDMAMYQRVKDQKKENKNLITIWYSEFERRNQRKPTDDEALRDIKGFLDGRIRLRKDYTIMKA